MIKIKFLERNMMLVRYNGVNSPLDYNKYLSIIFNDFISFATPNLEIGGGWFIPYNKLEELKKSFNQVFYENEYIAPPYSDMGRNMKLQPFEYQKETIHFSINTLQSLIVLPCGSGKTPIMIGIYLEAKERGIIEGPGLIVVKASLKLQWKMEVSKFSDLKANVLKTSADRCKSYNSKIKKIQKRIDAESDKEIRMKLTKEILDIKIEKRKFFKEQFEGYDLLIANYETLNDEDVMTNLLEMNLDCILCDEIHYVKSKDADRSKSLAKLNGAKVKIGATATPITKDPIDIYGIYKFINPDLLGSFSSFSKRYIKYAGFGKINGFKNTEELSDIISNNIFVKTKREISSQLPGLMVTNKYCNLTPQQQAMHEQILIELDELNQKDFTIRMSCKSEAEVRANPELQKISAKILALQTFAQELADSPKLLLQSESEMSKKYAVDVNSCPKLDLCLELVDEIIESGEKVIIFSKFERMQGILTEAINKKYKKKIGIAYVSGSLSAEERYEEAYTKFRDDDFYKIILMSDAGAEGGRSCLRKIS